MVDRLGSQNGAKARAAVGADSDTAHERYPVDGDSHEQGTDPVETSHERDETERFEGPEPEAHLGTLVEGHGLSRDFRPREDLTLQTPGDDRGSVNPPHTAAPWRPWGKSPREERG